MATATNPSFSILLLGAGRSATALIGYLADLHQQHGWPVTVADASEDLAIHKTVQYPGIIAAALDVNNAEAAQALIKDHQLVISLLPPPMHPMVASWCLQHQKHLITASYLSEAMSAFDQAAKDAGVLFLNECGLDPGIDHLSAMKVIDELKAEGATITRFASYCGGLIAPESDNNPWNYKITWNPMNVVLAGQGGITKFLDQGQLKYMPYAQLFGQATAVSVKGLGLFDAYPNRDSVGYVRTYGLEGIQTFIRGTLRRQGYCTAWQALVTLGYTDNTYTWPLTETTTWAEVTASFVPKAGLGTDLRQTTAQYLGLPADDIVLDKLAWLGLFEDTPVRLLADTPAKLLLARIEAKWVLAPYDKDLVVMQHQFDYTKADGSRHTRHADLAFVGQTQEMTAMAMGVGYPIGIAAKLIGLGQLKQTGVQIPLSPDYYEPILAELMALGITFDEYEV